MDINDNLQHMTTFTGGMDTDTSDMLLQADRYRLAKNLRLITDSTGNSGELHTVDNLKLALISGVDFAEDGEEIISVTQIRNYGIIVTQGDSGWYIYRVSDLYFPGIFQATCIFGPCTEEIGSNINMVCRWESDDIVKLYIADGKHSLMSINIIDVKNPIPTDISYLLDLKEYTLQKPAVTPNVGLGGTFKPGIVQYAYTLYNEHGSESNLSPLSNMYNVTANNSEGEVNTKTVTFSANIVINEHKELYNKIKVYRILYTQIGQDPIISLIHDDDLPVFSPSNPAVVINDIGTEILNMSSEKFLSSDKFFLFPNEIESKNNYLYVANVKDYFAKNKYVYEELRQDINAGKFTINTSQLLNNLNFNISYNDSLWNNLRNENSYFSWSKTVADVGDAVYMNDEIYRFGVVLYDKYGVQWPAIWIMDFRTPVIDIIKCKIWLSDVTNFLNKYGDFFIGYEIVRCNRTATDSHVLSQGIAGRALQSYNYKDENTETDETDVYTGYKLAANRAEEHGTETKYLTHSGFMTFTDIVIYGQHSDSRHTDKYLNEYFRLRFFSDNDIKEYSSSSNYIIFASPEACYQSDDLINTMKLFLSSLKIKTLYYKQLNYRTDLCLLRDKYNFSYWFNNFLNINLFPIVSTGIGFFSNRVALFARHTSGGVYDGLFRTHWHSGQTDSDKIYYDCNYLMYDRDNIVKIDDRYYNRLAMWFPIFAHKWLTPEYRDNNTSAEWSDSGVTYYHDASNDTTAPILNLIDAPDRNLIPEDNNASTYGNYSGNISKFSEINIPQYDLFMEGENLIFRNNSTIIDDKELLSWNVAGYTNYSNLDLVRNTFNEVSTSPVAFNWHNGIFSVYSTEAFMFPVSAVGKGIVLKTDIEFLRQMIDVTDYVTYVDENNNTKIYSITPDAYKDNYFWKNDGSLRRGGSGLNSRYNYYHGTDPNAVNDNYITNKRLSIPDGYVSIPIVEIVNDNCVSYGGFTDYARKNSMYQSYGCYYDITSTSIDYIPGDCFYTTFEYNSGKTWYNNSIRYAPHMTTIYKVPVVSKINMSLDSGDKFSRVYNNNNNDCWKVQDVPAELRNYIQDEPAYVYNTAYSNQNSVKFFTGIDYDDSLQKCDTRIFNSSPKENGEMIDSWLKFKSADFIDVDSRYGLITNLKLFKDTLVFNLETASGILSTNERTVITDTNNENILLGNGSVLLRYDYISTIFGMNKGDHSCGTSDTTLYWWDGRNKEMLMYNRDGFAPMKTVKNVKLYIDSKIPSTRPTIVYDNDHNEVLFNVVNNKTLAYNELTLRFVSERDYRLENVIYLPSTILVVSTNTDLFELNGGNIPMTPYILYVVNKMPNYNKVFDNITFGGRFFGGDAENIQDLQFTFITPLKQTGIATGDEVTNYEYDFRMAVPRAGRLVNNTWTTDKYGGRLRGKTMKCTIEYGGDLQSVANDFSLQYIITKYRMSWT